MRLADGRDIPADFVLVAIGVVPTDALARDGRARLRQRHPGRRVLPDVRSAHLGRRRLRAPSRASTTASRVRLESVDNAFEQGTSAALNMLGIATVHDKVPWFWSDQFDLKMVIVGPVAPAHDAAWCCAAIPASRAFSVCYLKDGELDRVKTSQPHQGPDGRAQTDSGEGAAGSVRSRRRRRSSLTGTAVAARTTSLRLLQAALRTAGSPAESLARSR